METIALGIWGCKAVHNIYKALDVGLKVRGLPEIVTEDLAYLTRALLVLKTPFQICLTLGRRFRTCGYVAGAISLARKMLLDCEEFMDFDDDTETAVREYFTIDLPGKEKKLKRLLANMKLTLEALNLSLTTVAIGVGAPVHALLRQAWVFDKLALEASLSIIRTLEMNRTMNTDDPTRVLAATGQFWKFIKHPSGAHSLWQLQYDSDIYFTSEEDDTLHLVIQSNAPNFNDDDDDDEEEIDGIKFPLLPTEFKDFARVPLRELLPDSSEGDEEFGYSWVGASGLFAVTFEMIDQTKWGELPSPITGEIFEMLVVLGILRNSQSERQHGLERLSEGKISQFIQEQIKFDIETEADTLARDMANMVIASRSSSRIPTSPHSALKSAPSP